jgi:hypothetical protein
MDSVHSVPEFGGREEAEMLVRTCMEPVIDRMRRKPPEIKEKVYADITEGQRAVFLFMMAADHASASPTDYYCWLSHLIGEEDTWSAVKSSLAYVGAHAMLQLWEETELLVLSRWQEAGLRLAASPDDLDEDRELRQAIRRQYAAFTAELPRVFSSLAAYVRERPSEFIAADICRTSEQS